jgi:prepilin peptidase CpaA
MTHNDKVIIMATSFLTNPFNISLFAVPLLIAAFSDFCWYKIPNFLTGCYVALFLLAVSTTPDPVNLPDHLMSAAIMGVAAVLFFAMGAMGGGDVKLLAGLGLWIGMTYLPSYLLLLSLSSLMLVSIVLPARWITCRILQLTPRGSARQQLPRILRAKEELPFGIAIAAAGLCLVGIESGYWIGYAG